MQNLTIEQLNQIIQECMGEPNIVTADGLDNTFPELGCDSLAILQVEARLSQDFGVQIPELMFQKMTPRGAISYVNQNAAYGSAQQQGA